MVILFDYDNLPEDVYLTVFATEQQIVVAKMLVKTFKDAKGELGKTEMSLFANMLHDGVEIETQQKQGFKQMKSKEKFSYNKRQFYDRILTPMRAMGMIDYDIYRKKYKISEKFNRGLQKIGLLWLQEVRKLQP